MIKHFINSEGKYLCIHACSITAEKVAIEEKDVTCKNCLRLLKKKNGKN